jgi:hypothetical protein
MWGLSLLLALLMEQHAQQKEDRVQVAALVRNAYSTIM